MPARDIYHNTVKVALIADGWTIIDEDYVLEYGGDRLYADLAAEKAIAAEKQKHKIVVEVKSFLGRSFINDLENAVGQYVIYRDILQETRSEYQTLYLAINQGVYKSNFQRKLAQLIVKRNQVCLLIFDIETQEVVKWIE